MRITKSTLSPWLNAFANITLPNITSDATILKLFIKTEIYKYSILYQRLNNTPEVLKWKSRNPLWTRAGELLRFRRMQKNMIRFTNDKQWTPHKELKDSTLNRVIMVCVVNSIQNCKMKYGPTCICNDCIKTIHHIVKKNRNRKTPVCTDGVSEVSTKTIE